MTATPEDFAAAFAAAFAARDAGAIAALCTEEAEAVTLTGQWAEGRAAIAAAWAADLDGALARARLVRGRGRLRMLGPGAAVFSQRFVVSGLVDAEGRDAGRQGVMLSAVLAARAGGWQAFALHLVPLAA